jgi:hypothetical protein
MRANARCARQQRTNRTPGARLRSEQLPLPRRPPQLHGPYDQWTRKKNGKTATRILTDEQLADYGTWFDNHRRLRELVAELEELGLAIAESDPRWNRQPHRPHSGARAAWPHNRNDRFQIAWLTPA